MPFSRGRKNPPEPLHIKELGEKHNQVNFQVKIKLNFYPLQVNFQVNSENRRNLPYGTLYGRGGVSPPACGKMCYMVFVPLGIKNVFHFVGHSLRKNSLKTRAVCSPFREGKPLPYRKKFPFEKSPNPEIVLHLFRFI